MCSDQHFNYFAVWPTDQLIRLIDKLSSISDELKMTTGSQHISKGFANLRI